MVLFFRSITVLVLLLIASTAGAASNEDCLECHSQPDLTTELGGVTVSRYVDKAALSRSVHGSLECIQCHQDADVKEFPHPTRLAAVNCGSCHDDAQVEFDSSIHGQALRRKAVYAPTCKECHGTHSILSSSSPQSQTYKMNIPYLCGKCHREGAPVARVYNISEHNILENYSESMHGEGLFKKGLLASAACTDCHGSHRILPHTNPRSSIARTNIAATCMKCHVRIEQVHIKIIKGELWERSPGAVPVCTDCHLPHKVRKESVVITVSDRACLACHEKAGLHKTVDGKSVPLIFNRNELSESVHRNIPCVKCHSDVHPKADRPCKDMSAVDCSNCHAEVGEEYSLSGHGRAFFEKNTQVPYCTTCHGTHLVKSHMDETASTYRSSIPKLCGTCHTKQGKAGNVKELAELNAYVDYSTSVHGRGLTEKGLLPSAVCTDCHNSHLILGQKEEQSSVNRENVPATCAQCHRGIYKQYIKSVHFSTDERRMAELPVCTNCHSSHVISDVTRDKFMTEVTQQCGSCHKALSKTYFETMHGKAYRLGYLKAAKCSDCHGSHDILPVDSPNSSVGFRNIVGTCRKCHSDANRRFTGYLTHATHHTRVKYPVLFAAYWAMTALLVGVFSFFGIHTLMWLPRSFKQLKQRKAQLKATHEKYFIRRFGVAERITHLFVILSFISLALTGMTLKFSSMRWAVSLAGLFGGVAAAGTIHRVAAVITFGYFAFHLTSLVKLRNRMKMGWREFIFRKSSMMFGKQDLLDFVNTVKWFLGRAERPEYGRWTYWEKFDYFAVFWGVAIIGLSGLMLWFPELFTKVFPGWFINLATIVHSDEALLAVGFIFTIHFFNTHLRPEAFPMDTVIFTGIVPLDDYRADRPRAYEELKETGELRKKVVMGGVGERWQRIVTVGGFVFLGIGLTLIGLIIYSVIFGYR